MYTLKDSGVVIEVNTSEKGGILMRTVDLKFVAFGAERKGLNGWLG